ncbi:MAG: alpha/beta fold hydrolase [Candidatus Thorarchaeota archaeon]|nr:MAG: alpha/beta fold hydrolase [Candidatus Thorarchaeota archaeon]
MEIDVEKLRAEFDKPHHIIQTSDDKILFLRKWEPAVPSKTAIIIFHGITAYSEPYDSLGSPLADAGFSVYGLDLRGHGLSDGVRGDYPSKERLVDDVCETIAFVKNQGFTGVILVGSSLGNVVALDVGLSHCAEHISGLILLSIGRSITPGAYPAMSTGEKLKTIGKMIFAYKRPVMEYKREGIMGKQDPLFNFKYSPRFLNYINAQKFMGKYQFPEKLDFPVLVGIGEKDEIFSIETARALFDEVPSENKEFQVIPGAKHAETHGLASPSLIGWLKKNFE